VARSQALADKIGLFPNQFNIEHGRIIKMGASTASGESIFRAVVFRFWLSILLAIADCHRQTPRVVSSTCAVPNTRGLKICKLIGDAKKF
jgi:hypothetical protein